MRGFARKCAKTLNRNAFASKSPTNRRTFITQAQRRKATTSAHGGLNFPIVDHHYEYGLALKERGEVLTYVVLLSLVLVELAFEQQLDWPSRDLRLPV
jgi:hypothetical protein